MGSSYSHFMVEIRIHGRGGQGVVSAADMFAMAAFTEGHYAQAFPSFGSERTGAPVVSYCRISDEPIRTREPVIKPDLVIVQDPTLLSVIDVFSGLAPDGFVLVNSSKDVEELGIAEIAQTRPPGHVLLVPAADIAKEKMGRPLPNAALLGAIAAQTGLLKLESVEGAIRQRFAGRVADGNVAAAQATYDYAKQALTEVQNA